MSRMTGWADAVSRSLPAARRDADELAGLVVLARSLPTPALAPSPDFRAALRRQLVTEAAARAVSLPAVSLPAPRRSTEPDPVRPVPGRLRALAATVTLTAVVTGAGAAAASTRALPGDTLYDLKRQIEAVQLALTFSDLARGKELLEQAEARLGEAERLAASDSSGDAATRAQIAGALTDWGSATSGGAAALTESYRDTGDAEPMQVLDRFVTDQQERLQDLLTLLDPSLRPDVRAALDRLEALGVRTGALLAAATGTGRDVAAQAAGSQGRASGDGWAVARLLDRSTGATATDLQALPGSAAQTGSGGAASAGSGVADLGGSEAVSGSTSAAGPLTGAVGGAAATGSTGEATAGVVGTVPDVLAGTGTTSSAPVPGVPAVPLPTLAPVPTATAAVATVPVVTAPALPLPTASASDCVPLPPLTYC